MQAIAKALQIKWHKSMAYHPQTDGQTERTNQELETYLCICQKDPSEWVCMLTPVKMAYNTRRHSVMQQTPFELLLGYMPKMMDPEETTDNVPAAQE